MKKILFICVENSCRSQMAEGWARYLGKGTLEAYSAGSKPSGKINADAIKVMQEIGVDISKGKSKGMKEFTDRKFDYVISMGCGDQCPFVPADQHIEWDIEDPKGKNLDVFRQTREQIRDRINELLGQLKEP